MGDLLSQYDRHRGLNLGDEHYRAYHVAVQIASKLPGPGWSVPSLQIETDHIVLEERDGGRLLRRDEVTDVLTHYFPREIRTMLVSAGFQVAHEQGSVVEDIPIDGNAGEMVFFCRRVRDGHLG